MFKSVFISTSFVCAGISIWWAIGEDRERKATTNTYESEKATEAKKVNKNKRKKESKPEEILIPSNMKKPIEETPGANMEMKRAEAITLKKNAHRLSLLGTEAKKEESFPKTDVEGVQNTSVDIVTPKQSEIENRLKKDSREDRLAFIEEQMQMWKTMKTKAEEELKGKEPKPIKITLPDGKEINGQSWRTTPYEVACTISQRLADNTIVSKVNGSLWDLDRPLETDCSLKLLKFDEEEAQKVFWHSTAHILGQSLEQIYEGQLCNCPRINEDDKNYYYDTYLPKRQVSRDDYPEIERLMFSIVEERQPFERLEMRKEDLLDLFKHNQFKVCILNEIIKSPTTTVYRCGPLINLCMGPHVRHTGEIKAFNVTNNSASYWEGNRDAESLQRVYGISFPDFKQLKEWKKRRRSS